MIRDIDQKLSGKLANLSFVCTLLVVFIHCRSLGEGVGFNFLRHYFPGAMLNTAVPAFFAMSGFFLAGKCQTKGWYGEALQRRIRSLLVPYIILNFLYWPVKYVVNHIGSPNPSMVLSWRTPFEILGVPGFWGPAIGPLWYVAALMYFVVLSPLLIKVVSHSYTVAIAFVVSLVAVWWGWCYFGSHYDIALSWKAFFYYNFSLWGLIFFVIGMATRLYVKQLPPFHIGALLGVLGLGSQLLLARYGLCDTNVYYIVPALLVIVGLLSVLPAKKLAAIFVTNSFAIYALHVPCIYFLDAAFKAIHRHQFFSSAIGVVIEFVAVVTIIVVLMTVLRKWMSRVVDFCFGGRC